MKNIDDFVKENKSSSSKFKKIDTFVKAKVEEEGKKQVDSYKKADKQFNPTIQDKSKPFLAPQKSTVSFNPANSSMMQTIDEFVNKQPAAQSQVKSSSKKSFADKAQGLNEPDASGKLKTDYPGGWLNPLNDLNRLTNSKAAKLTTEIGSQFVGTGATGAGVALLTGGAERLVGKIAPKLAGNIAGRITQKVAADSIVGAPLGVGQSLATGQDGTEALKDGLYGAALGGAVGGLGGHIGELTNLIKKSKGENSFNKMLPAYEQAARSRNILDIGDKPSGARTYQPKQTIDDFVKANQEVAATAQMAPESVGNFNKNTTQGFKVGDEAIPTTADGADLSAPKKVIDVQNKDGVNYYRFDGENTYMPEHMVRKVDEAPSTQPRQTIDDFVNRNQEVSATQTSPLGTRANFKNQMDNGNFSDGLKQKIKDTDQTYEKVTNQGSVDAANEAVKNLPKAESDFLLNEKGGPDHIATGYRLMQKLDALGEHERALIVSKKLAVDLTKGGQTMQAASILSRLSPEGQLLNLVRTAEKNGMEVSVADSEKFKELAAKVQEKSGAGVRANQYNEILNRMEKGENISVDDVKKLSDYLAGAKKDINPKAPKLVDDLPPEFKDVRKRDKVVSFLDNAEQAALARIKARKNNLNSLPLAEWGDHAIVVSSQIAKGTIKAATHVEDLVKMFGEEIRPVATQVFQKAQGLVKSAVSSSGEAKLDKALESFGRVSTQAEKATVPEKVVEKYVKANPTVTTKDIENLRQLAKHVTQLSGDEGVKADIAMQKILNSYEKSSVWDKVQAVRYMSMLLNSSTQAVNAISGPIMTSTGHVADVFGTMIDIAMNKALKTPRTVTLYGSNPLKFMARYFKNVKVGGRAGWEGVDPAGIHSTAEIRGLAYKSLKNPLGIAERTLGAVAKGADYATYKSVYQSEIEKQGYLDAKNKGIKGKANIQKHIESFVNEPTEEAMLIADRIGKNTTFQRSDSLGGKTANYISSAPGPIKPVTSAIVPFVRTPINIASSAVTLTPAGIIKGLYQLSSKSQATQREAIRTLSMGITGSGIGAIGYYLSQLGVVTGANDSGDKDVDAIKEQAGKGKYRFNTSALYRYLEATFNGEGEDAAEKAAQYQEGDKQFDYNKLQPLALPFAIGASLGNNKDKSISGKLKSAGSDAYGSLFGMSTLKGVQDIFQPSYGGSQGEKALGVPSRVAESFLKSFSPSFLGQEARRQDPIVRKTPFNNGVKEDVKGYFKSRTPGLSQSLPASKTTLGQDKLNAPGIKGQYLNPFKSDVAPYNRAAVLISDLIDITGDTSLAPSAPEKKASGKDKQGNQVSLAIPQKRYEEMQKVVGDEIISKILAMDSNLTDEKKADKIHKIYADARAREMNKVKKELGIRVQ